MAHATVLAATLLFIFVMVLYVMRETRNRGSDANGLLLLAAAMLMAVTFVCALLE